MHDARSLSRRWARASLLALALWFALAMTIDVRAGGAAWAHRTVSGLVLEQPILVPVSIFVNGVSVLCLAWAVRARAPGTLVGRLLLLAAGLTILAALVPTDPVRIHTATGWVHAFAAGGTFIVLNTTFWVAHATRGSAPGPLLDVPRALLLGLAIFAGVHLVHLGIVLVASQFDSNAWTALLGVWERLVILGNMSWVAVVAAYAQNKTHEPTQRPGVVSASRGPPED